MISYHDIDIDRLRKNVMDASKLVESLVNKINDRLTDATHIKYDNMLKLTNTIELYEYIKERDDE